MSKYQKISLCWHFPGLIIYKSDYFITERLNAAAEILLSPIRQIQKTMAKEKQPDLFSIQFMNELKALAGLSDRATKLNKR